MRALARQFQNLPRIVGIVRETSEICSGKASQAFEFNIKYIERPLASNEIFRTRGASIIHIENTKSIDKTPAANVFQLYVRCSMSSTAIVRT